MATIVGRISINVRRIEKALLVDKGENVYLDCALFGNKNGEPDQYGNDGFIVQGVPKALREANPERRGPIIGNWRYVERKAPPTPAPDAPAQPSETPERGDTGDDLPF